MQKEIYEMKNINLVQIMHAIRTARDSHYFIWSIRENKYAISVLISSLSKGELLRALNHMEKEHSGSSAWVDSLCRQTLKRLFK